LMVNFTAGGFYLAFLFPLIGFLVVLLRKAWKPGAFSLRGWTLRVAVAVAARSECAVRSGCLLGERPGWHWVTDRGRG
ncbi:hypothetical protein H7I76_18405, partial [Mycolicibacterium vaccae]|nr:hypothetical protein [Mycolicibacterium vaccae]